MIKHINIYIYTEGPTVSTPAFSCFSCFSYGRFWGHQLPKEKNKHMNKQEKHKWKQEHRFFLIFLMILMFFLFSRLWPGPTLRTSPGPGKQEKQAKHKEKQTKLRFCLFFLVFCLFFLFFLFSRLWPGPTLRTKPAQACFVFLMISWGEVDDFWKLR